MAVGPRSVTGAVGWSHFLRQGLGLFLRQAGALHQIFDQIGTFLAPLNALLFHVGVPFLRSHVLHLFPFGFAFDIFLLEEQHYSMRLFGVNHFFLDKFA